VEATAGQDRVWIFHNEMSINPGVSQIYSLLLSSCQSFLFIRMHPPVPLSLPMIPKLPYALRQLPPAIMHSSGSQEWIILPQYPAGASQCSGSWWFRSSCDYAWVLSVNWLTIFMQYELLLKSPADLHNSLSYFNISLFYKSNIVASQMCLHNCRCFLEHLRMLLMSFRAIWFPTERSRSNWKYLEALVRFTRVSGRFGWGYRTDLHFAKEGIPATKTLLNK
jgi:hypothetical protein